MLIRKAGGGGKTRGVVLGFMKAEEQLHPRPGDSEKENRVRDAQADSSRERNLHLLHHLIGCEWRSNPPTVSGGVSPLL